MVDVEEGRLSALEQDVLLGVERVVDERHGVGDHRPDPGQELVEVAGCDLLLVEGEPVGFYALVGEGCRIELEHLWVLPKRMGTGVGRALLEHAAGRAADLGAETLGIEADPNAEGFYRRMGARRVGETTYELDGQERILPLLALDMPPSNCGG